MKGFHTNYIICFKNKSKLIYIPVFQLGHPMYFTFDEMRVNICDDFNDKFGRGKNYIDKSATVKVNI